ncbi:MAG: ISL3 family transposase [Pseudonocardiales bacterium]|nr:ISL3 family transposase [Pseudonocardiales bacterium]
MRATTLLNRFLNLPGTAVVDPGSWQVESGGGEIRVCLRLTRRRLVCPHCAFRTRHRYDIREVDSSWRHLDLFGRVCRIRLRRRRLRCPEHGVVAEGVPFARPGSGFTRDFEQMVAWLVTKADKKTICEFMRIGWRTVGAIAARVAEEEVDPRRLSGLVDIGVDEISWKKNHHYLTLVSNHTTGKIVWGRSGKDTETLNAFVDEVGAEETEGIEAVSMDLGPAFAKSVRTRAPKATICFDAFHLVKLVTDALDTVRRQVWRSALGLRDKTIAKKYKGARWALLKNPDDLTADQTGTLREIKRSGGALWRAYQLKESLRAVFAGDLDTDTTNIEAYSGRRYRSCETPAELQRSAVDQDR